MVGDSPVNKNDEEPNAKPDLAKRMYRTNKALKGEDPDSVDFMQGFYNVKDELERSDFPNLNLMAITGFFDSVVRRFGKRVTGAVQNARSQLIRGLPALQGKRADQATQIMMKQPESINISETQSNPIKQGILSSIRKPKQPEPETYE